MIALRLLKWLLVTLLVVLIAAVLYLSYADLDWMKPRIESAVSEATGRTLKLNGELDLDIVPAPALSISDVSLSNAEWGSEPLMVTLGHFSTRISPWSLLAGPIRIYELELRDLDILLEKNPQETANWEMGTAVEKDEAPSETSGESSASDGLPVLVEQARIDNIKLTYREDGAEPAVVILESLEIATDEATYTSIDASASVDEQPATLAARLGPEEALVSGSGIEISLNPAYAEHKLEASGTLDALAEALRLHGWDIRYLDTQTRLDGTVSRIGDGKMHFDISTRGPSLQSLQTGLPAMDFEASLKTDITPQQVQLAAIDSRFGDSDLSGDLQITLGGKTAVSGKLKSRKIDLTPFAAGEGEGGESDERKAESEKASKDESQYVFKDEPLPLEQLHSVDLDLEYVIGTFIFQNAELRDVATDVDLKNGDLQLTNSFSGTGKGRAMEKLRFDASSGKSASMEIDARLRDLRANLLSGDGATTDIIPPIDITVDLKASGNSPRRLAASSTGRVVISQGKGKIESGLVGKFSGDIIAQLFGALNPFAKQDKYTLLECTVLGLKMNSGKTDISAMLFETEKIKAMGEGNIDLNTEALTMEFETQPRQGVGVSADMFVTPFVELTGTIASPKVGLNKKGALLKGGAAVATGGLSLLAEGAASRAAGGKDICAETLAQTGGHPPIDK